MANMKQEADDESLGATLGHRYGSAWSEINARLQSRQTVNVFFATVTVTVSSVILGKASTPNAGTSAKDGILTALSVGLVVLAWAFVFWVRHNDAIIGLLSSFCKAIERLDDPNNDRGVPAWHDDRQGFIVEARQFRKLSDWSTILLALLAAVPALFGGYHLWTSDLWLGAGLGAVGCAGVGAAYFAYRNAELRKRIASMSFRQVDGQWRFAAPEQAPELRQKA